MLSVQLQTALIKGFSPKDLFMPANERLYFEMPGSFQSAVWTEIYYS